jgi:uncharacterized protein
MVKPRGALCNLDCRYCYFLSKERLYPDSTFRMSDALLESYTRQIIETHQGPEVTFAWQGGEPTLAGLAFFERALHYQQQYASQGLLIQNTLQTNGTMLTDDWCRFFQEHNFLIGISIDGPEQMHNSYRVTRAGAGTLDQVLRGWDRLQRHGVAANILCTVHAANQHHPQRVYRFFRDELDARFIQFIPIVERMPAALLPLAETGWSPKASEPRPLYTQSGHHVTTRSVEPMAYGRFLITIFDEWVRHDVGRVFIQHFDVALGAWLGRPGGLCIFAPTCGRALALEHNGDLYACDHYVEPGYLLGNIRNESLATLVAAAQQSAFGRHKLESLPGQCLACEVRFACHGGCPKNRFAKTTNGQSGLNYLCAGYRAFFNHVDRPMRYMAASLQQGLPAAGVMAWQKDADEQSLQLALATAGRNDPCPCGSGRKFKQCHGRGAAST